MYFDFLIAGVRLKVDISRISELVYCRIILSTNVILRSFEKTVSKSKANRQAKIRN